VELLSLEAGEIDARNHDLEPAGSFPVDRVVGDARVNEFDGLVVPGGTVNADKLRLDGSAVAFVRDFVRSGKPVAAICHGPQLLISANALRGRTLTCWPSIAIDVTNAGGLYVDRPVAEDRGIITARKIDDVGPFVETILRLAC